MSDTRDLSLHAEVMTIKNRVLAGAKAAADALGPAYAHSYMAKAGPSEQIAPYAAVEILSEQVQALLDLANSAAADLEKARAKLPLDEK